jgi:hypothetical protein
MNATLNVSRRRQSRLRPVTVKPRDQRADVDDADQLPHAEPQRPAQAFGRAENGRLGVCGRVKGTARLGQQNAAGVGQPDLARGPLEQ